MPHSVTHISAHHGKTSRLNAALDCMTDVSDAVSFAELFNSAVEAALGHLDQLFYVLAYTSDRHCARHIPGITAEERSNVDLYDISLKKDLLF